MKPLITIFKALIICSLISGTCFSQSLTVFDIDASLFPTIKAKFYAIDASGKEILNLSTSDFQVTENGQSRNITYVSCPPVKPITLISVAMSIDVSGSMIGSNFGDIPVELGKTTATELCNLVAMPPSEFALQTCNDHAVILQDFTTNKNKILSSIPPIIAGGNNDFVEQLLNPKTGLLNIAKTGKYKRIAIIYTDAWWSALSDSLLQQCKDTCAKYNIQFYAVIYSRPEAQPNGIKTSLQAIADASGGLMYDGITSSDAAKDLGIRFQQVTQGGEPCQIEWQSDIPCVSAVNNVIIKLLANGFEDSTYYSNPNNEIAELDISPSYIGFKNILPGTIKDSTITVKAINSPFTVTNITISNPLFSIAPTSFSLNAGDSKILTVSFAPVDSSNAFAIFDFITNKCPAVFYASAAFNNKIVTKQTLKLTFPNGGEDFVVGSDTAITWTGVLPGDTVKLEYSLDAGTTWRTLTTEATGLSWPWKNIPSPASNHCLVRVSINAKDTIAPEIEWQKCFGGKNQDRASSIQETRDGGYIVAGFTESNDGDVRGYHGSEDFWILKLTSYGDIEWQKCLGGTYDDRANSIKETSDGGFIVAGVTYSSDGDLSGYHGNGDMWVVKLTNTGDIFWQKCIGGSGWDEANSIQETVDGGYIVAGFTKPYNGDYLIVKLSRIGDLEWQKTYGGSKDNIANSIQQTFDGGYIVAGEARSSDGDVTENNGSYDAWILKLTRTGDLEWQKSFGGSDWDEATSIQQTSDGGYIAIGGTWSNDSDVVGNHGSEDYWLLKLTNSGALEWQKCLGGSDYEWASSIEQTSDGGYIASGWSNSKNDDIKGHHGSVDSTDYWIVKLRSDGTIQWQKSLGGIGNDNATSIRETYDGGYIVAGYSTSNDGDVTGNHGNEDYWIVKLYPSIGSQQDISDSLFAIIAPKATSQDIDMKQAIVGSIKDSMVMSFITNSGSCKFRVDSIYFIGADSNAFSLVSGFPKYFVDTNSSVPAEFHFTPSRIGIHRAEIVIIIQFDTLIQNIQGEGVAPQIQIMSNLIDFGQVLINTSKDTTVDVVIRNVSPININITKTSLLGPDKLQFSIISGGGSFLLAPDSARTMKLIFSPIYLGRTSGSIGFEYNGFGSPAIVQLYGEGIAECKQDSFNFIDFSNTHNLYYLNSAIQYNNYIRLTPSIINQAGAVWYNELVPVDCDFDVNFTFQIKDGNNCNTKESSLPGADGIAFVIQFDDDLACGANGGGIGYDGIPNSLAVEFDTYQNDSAQAINLNDPNGNHVAVMTNGVYPNSSKHDPSTTLGINKDIITLKPDGTVYYSRISYSYSDKRLCIFLDSANNLLNPILCVDSLDFSKALSLFNGSCAYIGFTSATGNAYETHNLLSWSYGNNISTPTSVNTLRQAQNDGIVVFPNPANEIATIKFNIENSTNVSLKLTDMLGNQITLIDNQFMESGSHSFEWDASGVSSGVYYYELQFTCRDTRQCVQTGKVMVVK